MAARAKHRPRAAPAALPAPGSAQAGPGAGWILLACAVIVSAGLAAYSNSFAGVLLYDDIFAINQNPYAHNLWPVWRALWAPKETTLAGRPIPSLSVAINYAVSGEDVWSYHVFNLAVHLLAGLALFGVVRRTLLSDRLRDRFGRAALPLALAAAAIWVLHPLQTESVTYIIQRVESMMGLFLLLTLYCAIRAWQSPRGRMWTVLAATACALGMASKEVMAVAPVVVLLHDWAFAPGQTAEGWRPRPFGGIFRRRRGLYALLAATWLILAGLLATGPRPESAGFGASVANPLDYAASQFGVIAYYLRLSFWPNEQCLDYNWPVARSVGQILPAAALVAPLALAAAWALWRRKDSAHLESDRPSVLPAAGFAGAWFLVILAPTSSIVPIQDLMFEHRMYLPLAGVAVLAVVGAYAGLARLPSAARRTGLVVAAGLAVAASAALGYASHRRNRVYLAEGAIWEDAVAKAPHNARARHNLGVSLYLRKENEAAIAQLQRAVELEPGYYKTYNSLGLALLAQGRIPEAVENFQKALEHDGRYAEAHSNLGLAMMRSKRYPQAIEQFQQALSSNPDLTEAHVNWGLALAEQGRWDEAMDHYRRAIGIKPRMGEAHLYLGNALARLNRMEEAAEEFRRALDLKADAVEAGNGLAAALFFLGRFAESAQRARQVLDVRPDHYPTMHLLATVLAGAPDDAVRNGPEAVELATRVCQNSGFPNPAHLRTLAMAHAECRQFARAVELTQQALTLADGKPPRLAQELQKQLTAFQAGQPYRLPSGGQ